MTLLLILFAGINIIHLCIMINQVYCDFSMVVPDDSFLDIMDGTIPLLESSNWLGYIFVFLLFIILIPSLLVFFLIWLIVEIFRKIFNYAFDKRRMERLILPYNMELLHYCREKKFSYIICRDVIRFESWIEWHIASVKYEKLTRTF